MIPTRGPHPWNPDPAALAVQEPLTIFLILRAFSGGCAALTGTEAVANGVQYFRPPESRNAGITLVWMASILALSFLGVTFLAHYYHIVPRAEETVLIALSMAPSMACALHSPLCADRPNQRAAVRGSCGAPTPSS